MTNPDNITVDIFFNFLGTPVHIQFTHAHTHLYTEPYRPLVKSVYQKNNFLISHLQYVVNSIMKSMAEVQVMARKAAKCRYSGHHYYFKTDFTVL